MSGRCKACDVILFEEELTTKDPITGEYLELCFRCQDIAENPDECIDYYPDGSQQYVE